MTDRPPEHLASDDGRTGWFSYDPAGSRIADGDHAPKLRGVQLRALEHAGPFWNGDGHLSDDYEELSLWIGITRPLFDEVMAWREEFERADRRAPGWRSRHLAKQQELTSRLRAEVHPGITVTDPG